MRQSLSLAVTIALLVCGMAAQPAGGQDGPWQTYDTSGGEWRSYAGSIGGQKYSPWIRSTRATSRTSRSRGSGSPSTGA